LPRLDLLWQANRATRNNVFGLLLPQAVIPPISGPVLGTTSYDGVWGSAGGVLLSWQALDFGLRKANVDVARAQASVATAQTVETSSIARAALADAVGSAGATIMLEPGPLVHLPSLPSPDAGSPESHPAVRAASSAIEAVQARERALGRAYAPRLDLQTAFT